MWICALVVLTCARPQEWCRDTLFSGGETRRAHTQVFSHSPLALWTKVDPLDSKEATCRPRLTIAETSRHPHILNVARHRLLPV